MTHNPNVYGYVNGKPVFSRDELNTASAALLRTTPSS